MGEIGVSNNLTVIDEYFYSFKHTEDLLIMVCDDGKVAFTYPFDTILADNEPITSAEWDGNNWWTLQKNMVVADSVIIRRWAIDNFICKLQQEIFLNASASHKYSSTAFSVANYEITVTGTLHLPGATTIYVESGYGDLIDSGMTVTLENTTGGKETLPVHDAGDGWIILADPIENGYVFGDKVSWYTDIWLLNDYSGTSSSTGALYKINAYLGSYVSHYESGAYKDIDCCTFSKVYLPDVGTVYSFIYLKYRNLLFVDITGTGYELPYYGSMVLDFPDTSFVDMAIANDNIYFLFDTQYTLATLTPFINSIGLSASPAIIPANTVSTSTITAILKDQFNSPVSGKLVTFTDDDNVGSLLGSNPANTDINGRATIVYRSGNTARNVKITATADQ